MRRRTRKLASLIGAAALVGAMLAAIGATPAGATTVSTEDELRAAYNNVAETQIDLANSITLTAGHADCVGGGGELFRSSATALIIDGHGFTITQACPGQRVMEQAGGGALTLQNVTITGGTSLVGSGGGIISHAGGAVTLTNSVITGNTISGGGGGLFANGPVELTNSTVSDNTTTVGVGGGINGSQSIVMTNSTVSGNHAPADSGGGIHLSGTLTMTNSTISGNDAIHAAGAFAGSGATVTGSTISGNIGSGQGGGLHFDGSATITNSTITGNTASGGGGGVLADANLTLQYSTIVGNTGGGGNGANIYFRGPPDTLTSFGSVVALPTSGPNCSGQTTTSSAGYNFEDANSCGFGSGPGDQTNAGDPQLGGLGNNGGPTQTRVPQTGSGLLDKIPASSPCAGVNITVDQRGDPRPVTAGQFCDIGAVEVQVAALQSDDINFTG